MALNFLPLHSRIHSALTHPVSSLLACTCIGLVWPAFHYRIHYSLLHCIYPYHTAEQPIHPTETSRGPQLLASAFTPPLPCPPQQALLTWRDPAATALFVAGLALGAMFLWCLGLRVAIGALLLYDLRPPRLRDPWLPPPANMFGHLPTRADLMT